MNECQVIWWVDCGASMHCRTLICWENDSFRTRANGGSGLIKALNSSFVAGLPKDIASGLRSAKVNI